MIPRFVSLPLRRHENVYGSRLAHNCKFAVWFFSQAQELPQEGPLIAPTEHTVCSNRAFWLIHCLPCHCFFGACCIVSWPSVAHYAHVRSHQTNRMVVATKRGCQSVCPMDDESVEQSPISLVAGAMELEALPFTINGAIALGTLLAFQGIVARRLPSLGTSALLAVLLVGTGCCVDYISRREFPVHNSGAVVMTGASSGIGRGAAIALAKEGFAVFAGVRNERDAASIRGVGMDRLIPIILDVTKTDHIEAAVKTVEASGLLLVAVVNNAGTSA